MTVQHIPGVYWPWIRYIHISFDGLRGILGRKVFEADGTQSKTRIACRVEKVINSVPNPSHIRLWNLDKTTRSSFQRSTTKIVIKAGWLNQNIVQVFSGSLLTAQSNRSGADIVTSITAISGHDPLVTTNGLDTWAPGVPVEYIIRTLAGRLEGVTVGGIKYITAKVGPGGWTACGDTRATLDSLAREFGFSWTICDNVFQAIGDLRFLARGPIIKSPYLVEANPILTGPRQIIRGVSAKCLFNSAIKPGNTVTIKSDVEEQANGEHIVNWVAHNLDCHTSLSFTTEMVAFSRRAN